MRHILTPLEMQYISNALAPFLEIKQYLPHLLMNWDSFLVKQNQACAIWDFPTEPRLLRLDWVLLSPKVNEGCGPAQVTIWFFVQDHCF